MSRDYIRLRATTDRELLLEEAKEVLGLDEDAGTIDEALRRAISFEELTQQLRADARDQLKQYDMSHHRFGANTEIRKK